MLRFPTKKVMSRKTPKYPNKWFSLFPLMPLINLKEQLYALFKRSYCRFIPFSQLYAVLLSFRVDQQCLVTKWKLGEINENLGILGVFLFSRIIKVKSFCWATDFVYNISNVVQLLMVAVTYLQHCSSGISVYGFVLDRGCVYTIFAMELSIVLWALGKTLIWGFILKPCSLRGIFGSRCAIGFSWVKVWLQRYWLTHTRSHFMVYLLLAYAIFQSYRLKWSRYWLYRSE